MMKKTTRNAVIVAAMFGLSGCGAAGMMLGGQMKQYSEEYVIKSSSPIDVFGKLNAVAKETGFSVSGIGKANGTANLGRGISMFGAGMSGASKTGQIAFSGINTNTLKIAIMLQGNFDYGSKENADLLFDKISGVLKASSRNSGDYD